MVIGLIKSFTEKPWRSSETYQLIEDSLKERWQVESIITQDPDELHGFFDDLGNHEEVFAFNVAEYLDEARKRFFLPELLESWEIPHLGSPAQAVATGLDKARTKNILEKNGIPTPAFFVADDGTADLGELAEEIGYPLIVKPIQEGGHIGIGPDSIVQDEYRLETAVKQITAQYAQPALVEEYISGQAMREFSVGILEGDRRIFTPVEIDYEAMDLDVNILSYEAAQQDLERIKLVDDDEIAAEIIDLSAKTFEAVGAQDYSRIDLRMNNSGCKVLEINVMPGLGPHSFLPEAAQEIHGLTYKPFIQRLAEQSILKYQENKRQFQAGILTTGTHSRTTES